MNMSIIACQPAAILPLSLAIDYHHNAHLSHDVAANVPTVSEPPSPAVPSRSALRLLFSITSSFLCCNIFICLSSTPFNQYPNDPPMLAKSGYTHSEPLWKNGRISMPIWANLVAMPGGVSLNPGCRGGSPYRSMTRIGSCGPLWWCLCYRL